MMTPGEFNPELQRDPASQIKDSDVQTEGGLYVPGGGAAAKKIEADRIQDQGSVQSETEVGNNPAAEEKVDPATLTKEERDNNINQGLEDLTEIQPPELNATSEADFINISRDEANKKGENPEEAEKKAKSILDRAKIIAGMGLDEFVEANKGGSFDRFIKAFLTEGEHANFGGTSRSELRGSLDKDSSDLYLIETLDKGGPEVLIKFFKESLADPSIRNLDNIRDYVKRINEKADSDWEGIQSNFSHFLNITGTSGDHSFDKIRGIFERLGGMEADEIRAFFNIETVETSDETNDGTDDTGDGSTQTPGNVTPIPTQSQSNVSEPKAA